MHTDQTAGARRSRARVTALLGVLAVVGAPLLGLAPGHAQIAPTPGVWELTGPLSAPRFDHTTTLLASGKVLVAGGRNLTSLVNFKTAETYDPITETWTAVAPMNEYRWRHTATLLTNGKVLVTGGFGGSPTALSTNAQPVLNSAELYDPATNTWAPTGSMSVRRGLHSAALLGNAKVLVAGGRWCPNAPPATCDFTFRSETAELYDPATGTFTATPNMSQARHTTAAVRLLSGKVLVPAGFTNNGNGSNGDVYDPAAGTWSQTAGLTFARARQGGMLLADGRVLIAVGFGAGQKNEVYNPATNAWSPTGDLTGFPSRFNFNYAVLPSGKALVAGGQTNPPPAVTRNSDIYDPTTGQWSPGGLMNDLHGSGSSLANSDQAVVLSASPTSYVANPAVCGRNCGKVLVAGNSPTGTSELYTAAGTCYGFNATITGTEGPDDLAGTPGRDVILGRGGDDRIFGGGGDDVICAGDGNDQVSGGDGNDIILGGAGNDRIAGGAGDDFLFGEAGDDQLAGNAGFDTADGWTGTDACSAEVTRSCP